MIALQIQDVKNFMKQLLLSPAFDAFQVVEGSITTYNTFSIDGLLHPDFYTAEEQEELGLADRRFSRWQELRPFCLSLIKGTHTPLSFRFTFRLSEENTAKLLTQAGLSLTAADINGLLLNIRYDQNGLLCTTGTSLKLFTLDKSLDQAWDENVRRFFLRQELVFTLP